MALTKGFARNNAKTPLDQRLADMATIVCNAGGTPRTGVLGNANASIASALATWHFRVQAAEFVTSKGKADGVMIFTNDGVVDVPIAAGAPVSNSRIDVLWVKHEDNTTGDAASLPIFGVTSGAAAGSPTKPAIPTGAEEIATLRAYSGTTGASGGANILTNTYKMTAARQGVVPFRTISDRDAWTGPAPVDGQMCFVAATDATYQYLATAPTAGWYHVAGAPEIVAIVAGASLASATNAVDQGGVAQLRKHSGLVIGAGSLVNTGAYNVALGSWYVVGTISDASFRPDFDRFFATGTVSNATAGTLKIGADGNISWRANATANWPIGGLRIDLGGAIFTAKGLI